MMITLPLMFSDTFIESTRCGRYKTYLAVQIGTSLSFTNTGYKYVNIVGTGIFVYLDRYARRVTSEAQKSLGFSLFLMCCLVNIALLKIIFSSSLDLGIALLPVHSAVVDPAVRGRVERSVGRVIAPARAVRVRAPLRAWLQEVLVGHGNGLW